MSKQKPADTEDELSVLLSTRNITIAGRGLVIREYTWWICCSWATNWMRSPTVWRRSCRHRGP